SNHMKVLNARIRLVPTLRVDAKIPALSTVVKPAQNLRTQIIFDSPNPRVEICLYTRSLSGVRGTQSVETEKPNASFANAMIANHHLPNGSSARPVYSGS